MRGLLISFEMRRYHVLLLFWNPNAKQAEEKAGRQAGRQADTQARRHTCAHAAKQKQKQNSAII
jgi:hypothetical protein